MVEPAKAFEGLSAAERLPLYRRLAVEALRHYDLAWERLAFHTYQTNLHFRVTTPKGEQFMLRLASPGWRSLLDLQSEAVWLEVLHQETEIPTPVVTLARTGEAVFPVSWPEVPGVWKATLMSRVPGRLLGHYLTTGNLKKMGLLFADLHRHSAGWKPPSGFTTRVFEHWLSRGEVDCLTGPEGSLDAFAAPEVEKLIHRMSDHVEAAYRAADRSDLRVIHCDLWHDNIKLYRGVLHPFDFEDIIWGFRAHDIAMAMLDLLETVGEARYTALLQAFRSGYQTCLPWPEEAIEPFQIGRLLWKINWVARHQPVHLTPMVLRHRNVFEQYLQTGRVTLPVG